jgi:hypothetical protein
VRPVFAYGLAWLSLFFLSCGKKELFKQLSPAVTGIHFQNKITETDSVNVLDLSNIYNGGGVGIGDFNNDGLQDIYFTGNEVPNRLYLNRGNFRFEDVTAGAGVGGEGRWCRGVAVVDINNDGLMDIYVSATIRSSAADRRNLLYINQGPDGNGIPHFKEMAGEYGLADTGYSTQAAFFDYDNDGDLDVYVSANEINPDDYPNMFRPVKKDGSNPSTGRLYRNDWNDSLGHPVFTNVTRQARLTIEGYTHGVVIADINRDGWKDIFVSNDYLSSDLLYINNRDGTFTEASSVYFKHTSANAMGCDITDINNDGLVDLFELDMNPEDNYRKKMMLNAASYSTYQNSDRFGYQYQYVRNTLQLNRGPRVGGQDSVGAPVFSEIGFLSGIAETDWSWTPLITDFDNDGYRDIIVTNGFPKDITDHDFVTFRNKASALVTKKELLKQIPEVKLHNYAFRNDGNLHFTDVSAPWGLMATSFSNGAAYADLDNDGDMDLVLNNINDEAMLFRNMAREEDREQSHYLQVQCAGEGRNRNGLGAWIEIHYDHGKQQVYENTPYRGYLSSIQPIAHFGLGKIRTVDSLLVRWPDGKTQLLRNVPADQLLKVDIRNAAGAPALQQHPVTAEKALFRQVTDSVHVRYSQEQEDLIDFNIQKLLPHKFSEYGPALAAGDIDGNGMDDFLCGGAAHHSAQLFLQQKDGRFIRKPLLTDAEAKGKECDDLGLLLFDADNDGDLDLYIAGGGYGYPGNNPAYRDMLYVNDGKSNFTPDTAALPQHFSSKFCVRAADFDHDGDLDLFVSGRVDPWHYPKAVSSFIYRNDSENGHIRFTDVTGTVAKDLIHIGMVCDAVWTDFDNDGWQDLVLAGEWMPLTFLKNNKGIFTNVTAASGVGDRTGWWNSIAPGDFDNDGDMDYIVGNLGENSFYRASMQCPVRAYAGDFDHNGIYDMIPALYLPDVDGERKEFPAVGRDDLLKQINAMRRKFPSYRSYATATMDKLLSDKDRDSALIVQANDFKTSLLRNDGHGKFTLIDLPVEAQFSVINGMVVDDFDNDGNLDVVMNGNDYGTEVATGRYDALNGLYLKGDGKGNFAATSILQSGIFIPGNGKALIKLRGPDNRCLIVAGENRGPLSVFELKERRPLYSVLPSDRCAQIRLKNGKTRRQELYYGYSFLSQSSRFLQLNDEVRSVEISDLNNEKRTLK